MADILWEMAKWCSLLSLIGKETQQGKGSCIAKKFNLGLQDSPGPFLLPRDLVILLPLCFCLQTKAHFFSTVS